MLNYTIISQADTNILQLTPNIHNYVNFDEGEIYDICHYTRLIDT